jgi:hypothetical protein
MATLFALQRHLSLLQSSSASRFTAGASTNFDSRTRRGAVAVGALVVSEAAASVVETYD